MNTFSDILPHPDKPALRQLAKRFRNRLPVANISAGIRTQLTQMPIYQNARTILAFYPMGTEIDLRPLFADNTKHWYLPRMDGHHIAFYRYREQDPLEKHRFGVLEPLPTAAALSESEKVDLIILPGLMFDHQGHRLGYGQSFYDRFQTARRLLGISEACTTLGVTADTLRIPKLPHDHWDHPMDWVVTEAGAFKTPKKTPL